MDPFRGLLHIIIYTYIIIYIYIKITAISGRPRGNAQACIFYCPPQELIPLFKVFPYRRLGSGSTSVFYVTPWGFWGYPWGGALPSPRGTFALGGLPWLWATPYGSLGAPLGYVRGVRTR
jgi:hypothetical protein